MDTRNFWKNSKGRLPKEELPVKKAAPKWIIARANPSKKEAYTEEELDIYVETLSCACMTIGYLSTAEREGIIDRRGHSPLMKAILAGDERGVIEEMNRNPEAADEPGVYGYTPLVVAAGLGNAGVLEEIFTCNPEFNPKRVFKTPEGASWEHFSLLDILIVSLLGKNGETQRGVLRLFAQSCAENGAEPVSVRAMKREGTFWDNYDEENGVLK